MNCPVDHFIAEDKCWVCVQVERDKIILALLEAAKEEHNLDAQTHEITYRKTKQDCQMCKAITQAEERP